ncbi:helicase-related protein [Bacillaceae bacterium CLA-AA-H227]|uniref:Helicase C-terminal domain-containing protein n=2 Tax=Robertmurraya TaxID=2837507 RepID=A0A4U1CYL9_9BACI|nr:helicase-related protein [Robertmurraya kyonggiensis]TKC15002.1 hypothetical protein FA727_19075 [Robertmurraya kyonggiensis]
MRITIQSVERSFDARLHFAVVDKKEIVAASYVGVPESVVAITAGIIEAREVRINDLIFNRSSDAFRRLDRRIGMGDVAHGMVFNSLATIDGINNVIQGDDNSKGYIISVNGNIKDDISAHVIERFGLPIEFKEQYSGLFGFMYEELEVIQNPDFLGLYPNLRAVRFDGNEKEVLEIVESALKNGMLIIPKSEVNGVFNPKWSMKEYMINNAQAMNKLLAELKPLHTMMDKLDPAIATMSRIPFPAQAHVIQGIINGLEISNSEWTAANMGTGKSIQACGVAHVLHERRKRNRAKKGMAVLLSAPGITLRKWQTKEIGKTLPYAKTTIIRSANEALQMLEKVRNGYRPAPGEMEITIVGIDKAKRDAEPYFSGIWKRVNGKKHYGWHCPDCGRQLMKKVEGEWFGLEWSDVAYGEKPSAERLADARVEKMMRHNGIPKDYSVKWRRTKQFMKCSYVLFPKGHVDSEEEVCGTKLYRPAVKNLGETRNTPTTNISKVFKKMKKYFDLAIVDEAHQCKAGGSGRGDAYDKIVKSAKKNLNLTGTLVNGKASSMKELLWRTTPKDLIEKGFTDSTGDLAWAEKYGKLKQVVFLQDAVNSSSAGWVTRQRRKPMQPTEEPGIAPQMTAQFLLHKTAFLDIDDLGLPLVELVEKPIFIEPKPEHGAAYREFHEQMYDKCLKLAHAGAKGAWSKFNPAVLNYAARPDLGAFYNFGFADAIGEDIITAPKLTGYTSKEEWLINQIKSELAENRGVVIYNTYTGEYQLNERTFQILEENGVKREEMRILNESNTEKRSEVLQKYEEDGVKVVITNMKLVEVGLDLLAWPTIIANQLTYEVNVFRQAAKRSHRIGQHRLCKVLIPILNGTQEVSQFKKVMSARGHALMTEGRLDRGELSKYSYDEQSSLATDLAQCFAEADLANAWEELAAKEFEELEMIAESEFQQVLDLRMKELAETTLKLCGVATSPILQNTEEKEVEQDESLFVFDFSQEQEVAEDDGGFISVIDLSSYKKKRTQKAPTENQLVFNF